MAVASENEASETAITVAVRVRPFSKTERAQLEPDTNGTPFSLNASNFMNYSGSSAEPNKSALKQKQIRKVVHTIDDHVLVFDPPSDGSNSGSTMGASNKRHKDIRFVFDKVYGEESSQNDVYEGTTKGLLDSIMGGYNATVFAYGATGCGKTYTISGCPEDPGVIYLTMQELFERISAASDERSIELRLSYLEVYNETIRDLLAQDGGQRALALREDARQGVSVAGLSEHSPATVDDVIQLVEQGSLNRTMSPTEANEVSSRSHAVLQIHVRQRGLAGGLETAVTSATLSIIDLAGSERATVAQRSNGAQTRRREGANINRSLLALANCINALCDRRTKRHIPYRDSKLTRLLKFSLGGNCRTVMVTCVSPSSTYFEETHNTLKYATRAKNIRNKVSRNASTASVHVSQYQQRIRDQANEIKRLQRELANARSNTASGSRAAVLAAKSASVSATEARRQTQAIQAVQNTRNAMAQAYMPVREANWDQASAAAVERWYGHHTTALKSWREQYETVTQEQKHINGNGTNDPDDPLVARAQVFRNQVDELLRELARERATASRHADHAAQVANRAQYTATRAAQPPPNASLTSEQKNHIEQERKALELSAERPGLLRRAELAEHVADGLGLQNEMLMKLVASCLCNLRRIARDHQAMCSDKGTTTATDPVEQALDALYMQAISGFGETAAAVRSSMAMVRSAGGPSKLTISSESSDSSTTAVDSNESSPTEQSQKSSSGISPLLQRKATLATAATNGTRNNPNAAAISAAVAGTTRPRRLSARHSKMDSISPKHEPPSATARPVKGILKTSDTNASTTGPMRMATARRKMRQARIMTNPTARRASNGSPPSTKQSGSSPKKNAAAAAAAATSTNTRELSFKSINQQIASAGNAKQRPAWR